MRQEVTNPEYLPDTDESWNALAEGCHRMVTEFESLAADMESYDIAQAWAIATGEYDPDE
ncbi:MAG: hypothetical protein MHM6MM_003794 [Cercozoa sp. M6MM]